MAASAAAASLGLFSVARAAENGVTDTEVVLGHTGISAARWARRSRW